MVENKDSKSEIVEISRTDEHGNNVILKVLRIVGQIVGIPLGDDEKPIDIEVKPGDNQKPTVKRK